jgi:TPP-dependent indolepyruvate ferredoxin oxidoreductase alpha subunit
VDLIKKEMEYKGVSVIIQRRECVVTAVQTKKETRKHEA